jgi:CBS domain containing-hemolysin-like protein
VCEALEIKDNTFDEVKGESDTVAGLVLELAGKFPIRNDEYQFDNYVFRVLEINKNRIQKVKITIKAKAEKE